MNIFDDYSAVQIRNIFRDPINHWPEDFRNHVNRELAFDLLDNWLENHSDEEYRQKIRDIVESLTYGCEDDNGNEMLNFEV